MRHGPSLQQVQEAIRGRVCATCPYKTPGSDQFKIDHARPCEANCEFFTMLPELHNMAHHLDPMVGNRHRVLTEMLRTASHQCTDGAVIVRHHAEKALRVIEELFRDD